jgi:ATP-dependent Clp protease ATP-binding subunit ClpC
MAAQGGLSAVLPMNREGKVSSFSRYSFSDQFRAILEQAVRESDSLRHDHLGTGHILLAVLGEERGNAATILDALSADRQSIRAQMIATLDPGSAAVPPNGERPYSAGARKVLELAMASAGEFGEVTVDGDHLLIGLVSVDEAAAARILAQAGVTREMVIQEARRRRQ